MIMSRKLDGSSFLKKHLQCYEEKNDYCSGKYVGSVQHLVESFIGVTNSVFRHSSVHRRGKSKRLKQDSSSTRSNVLHDISLNSNTYQYLIFILALSIAFYKNSSLKVWYNDIVYTIICFCSSVSYMN